MPGVRFLSVNNRDILKGDLVMNRHQIYAVVVWFLALVVSANVANAQSKDRDNPTSLTSNVISGLIDSESRGNYYFYSFMANPGEISITLTVEPGRSAKPDFFSNMDRTAVGFTLFDHNAAEIAGKIVSTAISTGSQQAVARVEVTRRQLLVLSINIQDGAMYKTAGGKYRIRIEGAIELGQNGSPALSTDKPASSGCLPKQGTLIIKMKDGSKKIIDLSEAETVTVVP